MNTSAATVIFGRTAHACLSGSGTFVRAEIATAAFGRRPLTLLRRATELLEPGGRLIIAMPLPLSPHVHVGAATVDPEELLPIERSSFEAAAQELAEALFATQNLSVEHWTRAPYLCRGDTRHPVLVLDHAIFVLRDGPK